MENYTLAQPCKFYKQRDKDDKTSEFVETKGTQVLKELGDFFVSGNSKEWFTISEGKSGHRVCVGRKRKDALAVAKERIECERPKEEDITACINFAIKTTGLSPRWK